MQIIRRHTGQLCGSALTAKQPLVARPDTIACSPTGDAFADLNHFPRQITANHKRHWQLHRHQAASNVGINRIHRSGGRTNTSPALGLGLGSSSTWICSGPPVSVM